MRSSGDLGFRGAPLQETADRLGRLRSTSEPVGHTLLLENQLGRIAARVEMAQDLDKSAIASILALDHHNPVTAFLISPGASQTYL
jgi:hypothetical protein